MTAGVQAAEGRARVPPALTSRPDLLGLLLFFAMVQASAWPLPEARWTAHLEIVGSVGGWGVLSGALAGRSRLSPLVRLLLWFAYGVFLIGLTLGATLDAGLTWHERSLDLLHRIGRFTGDLLAGRTNSDALMFVFCLAVLYWTMGFAGAWALMRRGDPWLAILPSGIALAVHLASYGGKLKLDNALAVFALLSILLLLRLDVSGRQAMWRSLHSTASPDATRPILLAGGAAAFALVVLAWGGPAYARSDSAARAWTRLTRPWTDVRERFDQTFRSVRNPSLPSADLFGGRLALAAGETPATGLVLRVTPSDIPSGGRFYWRSRVYAAFEEGNWTEAEGEASAFTPQAATFRPPVYRSRRTIDVAFESAGGSLQTLFLPSQPVWVDRDGEVIVQDVDGGTADVLSFVSDVDVRQGEMYRARASIALPTGNELRRAGTAYPAWVVDRYLQLPEDLTPRTAELAYAITADAIRPYDQAMAVTRWLRENIVYQRQTKAPPANREPLDWFLFDYRTGFCNWNATAEVILLRSLGIPARLAAGYAQGNLVPAGDTLTLREESAGVFEVDAADAHVWPEVFFPGYGWVEFEPTPSQPELIRPESDVAPGVAIPGGGDVLLEPLRERLGETVWATPAEVVEAVDAGVTRRVLGLALAGAAVVALIAGTLWLRADPLAWTVAVGGLAAGLRRLGLRSAPSQAPLELRGLTPTGRIYLRWCLWLKRLGLGTLASHTPYERAAAFADVLPEFGAEGWHIARSYTAERFGGRPADVRAVRAAWRRIRRQLWQLWIMGATKA
jgi:transglutaminase-like putative cysteine protease